MYFSKLFDEIWRAFETDEVPSSGAHNVIKEDVQDWGAIVEAQVQLASTLATDRTGSDVDTAQAVFGTAADALTLDEDATYEFEALYWITRAAGSTSHTSAVLFGGDATIEIAYLAQVTNPTGNVLGAVQQIMGAAATAVVLTGANVATTENLMIRLKGIIRVDEGNDGTLIPQFKYSAAPGGAPTIKAGTFFKARKLGAYDVTAIGPWG